MKKGILSLFALPLVVAACTSEEDQILSMQENDQYANIPKVEATFDWGAVTRLNTQWGLEEGDVVGMAWLGVPAASSSGNDAGAAYGGAKLDITGNAYQNHPLTANANEMLQPATSIYVGKYYTYLPYDEKTQNIAPINFSVAEQTLEDGNVNAVQTWNGTAKNSIWISPKWTDVTLEGVEDDGEIYDNAGLNNTFRIYPRKVSNNAKLEFTYKYNELESNADYEGLLKNVEIFDITVGYKNSNSDVAVTSFTYAPTTEPLGAGEEIDGDGHWMNSNLKSTVDANTLAGVTAKAGVITLAPAGDAKISTTTAMDGKDYVGNFYYNALPANTALTANDEVEIKVTSTYGVVTINKDIDEIAYSAQYDADGEPATPQYLDYADGAMVGIDLVGTNMNESFLNTLYRSGKFVTDVDFSTAVMDGMHVENDDHLQLLLNFYKLVKVPTNNIETKSGTDIQLYLDGNNATDKEFHLSLESIALLQEINKDCSANNMNITIQPCTNTAAGHNGTSVVVVTGNSTEMVSDWTKVFEKETPVTLRGTWTWSETEAINGGMVKVFNNEGEINVTSANVADDNATPADMVNTKDGEIFINAVTEWKNIDLTNLGVITIDDAAELRAYGTTITNDATGGVTMTSEGANYDNGGKIYNYGVLGVTSGTSGRIDNYGYIMNFTNAKTYITTNQLDSDCAFADEFNASSNKIGTIELGSATDNISVSNATSEGFIKYVWDGGETYETPSPDVKYNYLIVKNNLTFAGTAKPEEIQYIEVNGTNEVVFTFPTDFTDSQSRLDGFILPAGTKANIKEGNALYCEAAYLKGTIYVGGLFYYKSDLTTFYGGESDDQDNVVEY